MWPDGLVALTHAFRLVALLSFSQPRILPLADPHLTSAPTAMCLLHQPHDASTAPTTRPVARLPEVVLAHPNPHPHPYTPPAPAP